MTARDRKSAELSRFAPQALELMGAKLEERERSVVSKALGELNSEDGLSPQRALEHWIAVREVRRLRNDLVSDVRINERQAREQAEALSR